MQIRRIYLFLITSFAYSLSCTLGRTSSFHRHDDESSVEFADKFPSLEETLRMAKLSKLAYKFRKMDDDYCQSYGGSSDHGGVKCEWYNHNRRLGTQVLMVSNALNGYIGVVFAGTDDIRTSLEDAHITQKPFGNNSTISLPDKDILVHAGFDNAVFLHGMWEQISSRLEQLTMRYPTFRIYTSGHSLGGANSLLTATALGLKGHRVTSISFGCPHTGNEAWNQFFNGGTSHMMKDRLAVWRVVLGWDLVPRLPDFSFHAGHTIQLWDPEDTKDNARNATARIVEAYYQHYGNESLHYAGVPPGWNTKSHLIGPGALTSHFLTNYIEHLEKLSTFNIWVDDFQRSSTIPSMDYNGDIHNSLPDDVHASKRLLTV